MGAAGSLIAALGLVAANAFFVAVEFALLACDRTEVEMAVAGGDRRSMLVSRSLSRLSFHLSGVQLGITVCSVLLGVLAEPALASFIRPLLGDGIDPRVARSISIVAALFIATAVQMVVAELVPKAVAVSRPLDTARRLARANLIYSTAFSPVIRLFAGAADRAVRRLGIEPAEELVSVRSRPELVRLVESSRMKGTLESDEAELLSKAFRFGEKTAADALTPRTDMISLPSDGTGAQLIAASAGTGFSRFPVTGRDRDDVVGVVHAKALLSVASPDRSTVPISTLMDEPFVVPEARKLDTLLFDLRERAISFAVVLDEYGGTAGIITLEDLVEEIVGEIDDEYDRSTLMPLGPQPERMLLPGTTRPDELRAAIGFTLPDGSYETLAGFLLDRLGHLPEPGEQWTEGSWRFEVLTVERRRIAEVAVDAEESQAGPGDGSPS